MASKLRKLFSPSAQKLTGDRRKKLLVLNLGGLLLQNIRSREEIPHNLPHDISRFRYGKRIVFKRPFYEEFLEFCFERFDVGIWSSIQSQNLEIVLKNIMGESKNKLKFAWHQGHCTIPGSKWKVSERRPLFLKDLKKLAELSSHSSLSNTLLIDNEPYKALLNPQNTAIFPNPYTVSNDKDTFLGPEGEMRVFLDGLVNAEDVPSYVEENRIGQPAVTPSHPDWGHYSDMLKSLQRKCEADGRKSGQGQEKLNGDRRKKLLVLNFGGLLYQNARSVIETPKYRVHDFTYAKIKKFVFKRPFYEEFLEFCFERFDVGVWASIQSKNLDIVLENMMGTSKSKLLFAWDNERWPIFMKNLHKLRAEPHLASDFSLSNTLLIDNAPFRGLLNPPNTGIFPYPYDVSNDKDDFLGPEGEMRAFLDGLANAEDVRSYVEENRIGQPALTPSHPDWSYYSDMLMSLRIQEGDRRNYNFNMVDNY